MTGPTWHLAQVNIGRLLAPPDDPQIADFVTGLETINALADSVGFMRRRREWFEKPAGAFQALWWVPEGTIPTVDEAMAKVALLDRHGSTAEAFTFRARSAAPTVAKLS